MKNIRILAFLLVFSIVLSVAAMAAGANGFVWSISSDKQTLSAGESVEVTVMLAPGGEYYEYNSAEIYVRWDPAVFSVSNVKGENGFKATALTDDGDVHIFANRYTNSTTAMLTWSEEKAVMRFTLTALQDGASDVTLYRSQITQTVQYVPQVVASSVPSPLRLQVGNGQSQQSGTTPNNQNNQNGQAGVDIPVTVNPTDNNMVLPTKVTTFADVPTTHWAHEAVTFCVKLGLFTGTSATTFSPESPVTRGMFMTVLARAAGADTNGGTTWYEKGQQWAMENEVSDGSNPELPLTREQLVTMLYRFVGSPWSDGSIAMFPDAADASSFAQEALCWATKHGIINGINGNLSPSTGATRAQLAAILMRWSMMEY